MNLSLGLTSHFGNAGIAEVVGTRGQRTREGKETTRVKALE